MTPEEHYTEAERLLGVVTLRAGGSSDRVLSMDTSTVALAQVHATLATSDVDIEVPPPVLEPSDYDGSQLVSFVESALSIKLSGWQVEVLTAAASRPPCTDPRQAVTT